MDNGPAPERKKESIETCRKKGIRNLNQCTKNKKEKYQARKKRKIQKQKYKKCPVHDCTTGGRKFFEN